jgi:putative nucleotidyltransferase with HDIG domain
MDRKKGVILEEDSIELVILDIRMPGKSGVELLSEIKAKYPDTAVVMATAIDDASTAINCMKAGAYDYVTKPFNLDEVSFSVRRALEKRRLELENRDYQQHLEQKVEEQAQKIRASFFNAITALAYALEAKDVYTSGHSQRVTEISEAIAEHLGLPRETIEKIRLAGLVHDIGKIGVRESVLNKPGSLSDEEFKHVRLHSQTGERILKPIVDDKEILKAVRHHHERYDGAGYPDGLKGEQIPQLARIIAVADTFDAMTSERSYRKALTEEEACAEVERCRGTQFDPEAADAFLEVWRVATKTA